MVASYISALDSGSKWASSTITYSFNTISGHYSYGNLANNVGLFNSAQQSATEKVFTHLEEFINVDFRENGAIFAEDTNLSFFEADLDSFAGFAYFPSEAFGSDVIIDRNYDSASLTGINGNYYGLAEGQFGYLLLLHEIGHAMGLDHSHEGVVLNSSEDSVNATVMSYSDSDSSKVGGDIATSAGPTAPWTYQLYDIAALQSMYGANTSFHAGDDTYALDGSTKVFTIWDGGGSDTYDASSYTGGSTIVDIREGLDNVTTVGDTNVWVAFNANIENAFGSDGNDTVYGNDLSNTLKGFAGDDSISGALGDDWINGNLGADVILGEGGNDTLRGGKDNDTLSGGDDDDFVNGNNNNDYVEGGSGADILHGGKENDTILGGGGADQIYGDLGNDTLKGEAGSDTFIFKDNSGVDTVQDFTSNVDIIRLIGTGLDSSSVFDAITFGSTDSILTINADTSVTLTDYTLSSFDVGDFLFS